MRVIVCGGRDFGNLNRGPDGNPIRDDERAREYRFGTEWLTRYFMDYLMDPDQDTRYGELTIISGGAKGADALGEDFAVVQWLDFKVFKADWEKHGKAAGYIRNKQMLEEGKPDLVIAFPGGRGTENMKKIARDAGVEVVEVEYIDGQAQG